MKAKILSLTMLVLIVTLALVACGDSDEHTHTWEAATCITAKTCSECGIETGTVSTTNHNYGEWQTVKTVSCTEDGTKKQTCSWCNNEKTETITSTGHSFVNGVCNNCNTAEKTSYKQLNYQENGDCYEWFLGIQNEQGVLTKANLSVTVEILNNNESVYKHTFHITTEDFKEYPRANGDLELRAKFVIYKNDVAPGVNKTGTFTFDIKGENVSNFTNYKTSSTINELELPQIKTNLNIPTLPKTIYNKSSSGTTNQMIKVTNITYETSGTTMYIYFSGEKTFDKEGNNYSRISKIGFKLYDSNGNVVDSGIIYVTALSVGDKFANTKESVFGITLGENYTIELIDVTN